jgi:hypothetical protein
MRDNLAPPDVEDENEKARSRSTVIALFRFSKSLQHSLPAPRQGR